MPDWSRIQWKECHDFLWRSYSDLLNVALLKRWLPGNRADLLLKTDLFDEAVTDGLYPFLTSNAKQVIGIDLSLSIIRTARLRHASLQAIKSDVRCLPFPDGTFNIIVSNSTLDHFESPGDIVTSLCELHRVLKPCGLMILTLDNPANPIVLLRNELPFRLLNRLGIVPYYVGVTLGPYSLQRLLRGMRFNVIKVDTVMHCPRVLAVVMARWMERHFTEKTQRRFLRFLMAFESLSHLPTHFYTGYFLAAKCSKV